MISPEAAVYFSGFTGLMGRHQLMAHLTSHPQWWALRDEQGRTPLMRAMFCKGASPDILCLRGAANIFKTRDAQGHNLWYHLFLNSHTDTRSGLYAWQDALNDIPLPPSSDPQERGWMIEAACHRWPLKGQVDAPGQTNLWLDLNATDMGPLLWRCNEEDGQRYRRMLTQRFEVGRSGQSLLKIGHFVRLTADHLRASLATGVLDVVSLLGCLTTGDETSTEHLRQMYAEGRPFLFSPAGHLRLLNLRHDGILPADPLAFFVALHEGSRLSQRVRAPHVPAVPPTRLRL